MTKLFWKMVWVACYIVATYFAFSQKMNAAIYWIAGTLLAQSIISLFYQFFTNRKKNNKY